MQRLHRLFAILSLATLALIVDTAYLEHEPHWERYQKQYLKALAAEALGSSDAVEIETVDLGIQQDWLPELNRTDRCRTCHVGIENPGFWDAPQPLKAHPEMPRHSFDRFGCTVCHEGQGRATTEEDAHGYVEHWPSPMHVGAVVEGSCGKCHMERAIPLAPTLTKGRRLIEEAACIGCHEFEGLERPKMLAPDLVGLGSKVKPEWLYQWLKRPKDYLPQTRMPNFHLTEHEIFSLMAYLLSYRNQELEGSLPEVSDDALDAFVELGETRFRESRCISCHSVFGRGESVGPELGGIESKAYKNWIYEWLSDPTAVLSNTRMPNFTFPDEDIRAITEYIYYEFIPDEEIELDIEIPEFTDEMIEEGKKVARAKGCYGCHVLPDFSRTGEIGPTLVGYGSKPVDRLDFGDLEIERSLANWTFVKLHHPGIFREGLKMPDYEFTLEESEAMTAALMGETHRDIPARYVTGDPQESPLPITGPFRSFLEEYRCLTCHSLFGSGGTLAPDLSAEGSQVQTKWLVSYLQTPYAIRPYLTVRMPRLRISNERAEELAGLIKTLLRNNSVDEQVLPLSEADAEHGRKLFFETYTCWTCHIVGDESAGYYGPQLNTVGDRLTPEWIFSRLKDPQKYFPEVREPDFGLSDADALDLTAYLMSLGDQQE